MDGIEIEAAVATAVRKAMAAEARRAGQRRHADRHLRWRDMGAVWGRNGKAGA